MCGIIGKVDRSGHVAPVQNADLDRIKHRGPDDRGFYCDGPISLGQVRLSIIDLSPAGHQPMASADARYHIVYNGEVYNYIEVREELRAAGVLCRTQTDTEVVLNAYRYWGPACLQKFRGMFALAIWDRQEQTLFLARDRCGEKPLIYYRDDRQFFFASEFKGLVPLLPEFPRLDPAAVDQYLHYQYMPEPQTLLMGVHKLPAAHYAVLDVKKWSWTVAPYWRLSDVKADASITPQDIRHKLDEAVKLSLRADVPVGVALSAGLDSAGIAAIAARAYGQPLQAFCVGYPGRPPYDERAEAKKLADLFGCPFTEVELPTEKFVGDFENFAALIDEPIADIAAFGHYAVPKACADHGIKVLLTGLGGDELFWGYDWCRAAVAVNQNRLGVQTMARMLRPFTHVPLVYKGLFHCSRRRKFPDPVRNFFRQILAGVDYNGPTDQLIFMAASGAPEFGRSQEKLGRGWYGPAMENLPPFNAYGPTALESMPSRDDMPIAIMELLFKTWLTSNCLSLGDRVSMAVSVETRLPLLDAGLIETVVAYRRANPDHTLGQKAVLRQILSDVLPPETTMRRKSGFVPPVNKWLAGIADRYGEILPGGMLLDQGIVSPIAASQAALSPHTRYRLILLEQWYRNLRALSAAGHAQEKAA